MQETIRKRNEFSLKLTPRSINIWNNYRERLIAREDQGKFYWELRSCAYYDEFENFEKLFIRMWQNISKLVTTNGRLWG